MSTTPVLEVGGTHVTAALVTSTDRGPVAERVHRTPLRADGSADEIIASLARAAGTLDAPASATWGVAIPGPFDYAQGIGLFADVRKFDALHGVDLRQRLLDSIRPAASQVRFLNDADAFGIGEWAAGAARGHDRVVGLTLGTGIGSVFLDRGCPVHVGPQVPPGGYAHLLEIAGRPLEDTVSRDAVLALFRRLRPTAPAGLDVRDLAGLARDGDPAATQAMTRPMAALGEAIAPWIERFAATIVIVGGGMAESWDLVGPPVARALHANPGTASVAVAHAGELEHAALIGAALHAAQPDGLARN